jgi:choline dehydrogenase-like flavoprotein
MKVAVIGSGPAAAGTCLGLAEAGVESIEVFDIGRNLDGKDSRLKINPAAWNRRTYQEIHAGVRKQGKGWIPEKSYFSGFPSKYSGTSIYRSDVFGGLSKFWGASFLPFTTGDLADWPVSYKEMSGYYRNILQEIRVTGRNDQLSTYFSGESFNEKPIRVPDVLAKLQETIACGGQNFIAGSPRLAVTTSGEEACTFCGHCFYGCYRNSIYSSDQTIRKLAQADKLNYVPGKRLLTFNTCPGGEVEAALQDVLSGRIDTLRFDKLYLACGCIESTRIVSESLGLAGTEFPIVENPMYHAPIIYTGLDRSDMDHIIALQNVLIGCLPSAGIDRYVHIQVYPLNTYLWNHAFTKAIGSIGVHFSQIAQKYAGSRLFMMLIYLHGDYTAGSRLTFEKNDQSIRFKNKDEADRQVRRVLQKLSDVLKGSPFFVLKDQVATFQPGTSNHYAGTVPMGNNPFGLSRECAIVDRVYMADSATFPTLPAQNHSFTIMANAYRVALESNVIT